MHILSLRRLLLACGLLAAAASTAQTFPRETKPWTRWWWPGSAVDTNNVTRLLTEYRDAGYGGVEICPIYGAKGAEERFIDFLSPQWMAMLAHTTREAERLGLGVDMTAGTGWPFGGPWVTTEDASSRLITKVHRVKGGKTLNTAWPEGTPVGLFAVPVTGTPTVIEFRSPEPGPITWTAPPEGGTVVALTRKTAIQNVKRAAPGGAGPVLDPYNPGAMKRYLERFDRAFAGFAAPMPRAYFHDSFEYYGADWTPELLKEFETRRGYDLRAEIGAFAGIGESNHVARVKADWRATLGELHLETMAVWTEWSHRHGGRSRNQSHGAPANLLDLYAAVDIPETEIFRHVEDGQLPMIKLASSGAHLAGRPLTSAESFTWLKEHFQGSLADLKPAADFLFLGGVNHLFYHGVPYSPEDAGWPGWLFYASVHCGPNGGLWRDLPAFNAYVARCQQLLQAGRPDPDVLLYFPVHEVFHDAAGGVKLLTVHAPWLQATSAHRCGMEMTKAGIQWDWFSDRLLAGAKVEGGRVVIGDARARALLVPPTRFMPPETLERLRALAEAGATVLFQGSVPQEVGGLGHRGRDELRLREISAGAAAWKVGTDLAELLRAGGVTPDALAATGLPFVRRTGPRYLVVNPRAEAFAAWVAVPEDLRPLVRIDPLGLRASGQLPGRRNAEGGCEVWVEIGAGESALIDGTLVSRAAWSAMTREGTTMPVTGRWKVSFIAGGPVLPQPYETEELVSWTTRADPELKRFSGTARYTLEFDAPNGMQPDWLLRCEGVRDSARVRLNGAELGVLFCAPWELPAGRALKPGRNVLEIEVTNAAANRIADLDRRGVEWKNFHEINFVNTDYKPFDASGWAPREAGLTGPVVLIPLRPE